MVTIARRAAALGALLWALGPCVLPAAASPVIAGPQLDAAGEVMNFSYSPYTPFVQIGAPGAGVEVAFNGAAGPIVTVFEVQGPTWFYHHLHLVEYWTVAGTPIHDWFETLMVPDGEGGWTPSPNGDDLWYSCRYEPPPGQPRITPLPVVTPEPTLSAVVGNPTDTCAFYWDAGVAAGTVIQIDKWVTVPASVSTFAIYQYAATPEPGTVSLVVVGLGLLAAARRKGT